MFSYAAFLNVVLTYGMETAFFNFSRNDGTQQSYSNAFRSLLVTTVVFFIFSSLFSTSIASFIGYEKHPEYVLFFAGILFFDTLSALPFALLRKQEKPWKYTRIKLFNIGINVTLNIVFLLIANNWFTQIQGIFLANLVASAVTLPMLWKEIKHASLPFDKVLFSKMVSYSWPLVFVGLAGITNEALDRILIKKLLPDTISDYEAGLYGSYYRLSMVLTLFIQAYRFAAEPFFFNQTKNADAKHKYAETLKYFTYVCALIFLSTSLWIEPIAKLLLRNEAYLNDPRSTLVIPVLMMANLLLGIYYNLSIWYKLSNKNTIGAIVAIGGAIITLVLNLVLIPEYSFVASAWITASVYLVMVIASAIIGKKYYPVSYSWGKMMAIVCIAVFLSVAPQYSKAIGIEMAIGSISYWLWNIGSCLGLVLIILAFEKKFKGL